jgi:hypothetical protein
MHLYREKLQVEDLVLVVYYADESSPTAEKLRVLDSLTSPPQQT